MSEKDKKNQIQEEDPQDEQVATGQQEAPQEQHSAQKTEADADSLQGQYEKLSAEFGELKDKYLRLYAEFDNFKKRTIREKMDMMKNAAQDTMSELLPVLDDFDRAHKAARESGEDGFSEGVKLVYNKLYATLKKMGLEPMESTGHPFDPELHDAITEIPAPSEDEKGHVIDTIEKGYKLNGKIIRHAKVVVGK